MSIWAHIMAEAAEAGLAGLDRSSFAFQSPAEVQKQRAKAGSCTPCAAAARLERAQNFVKVATGQVAPPQTRRRKAAGTP